LSAVIYCPLVQSTPSKKQLLEFARQKAVFELKLVCFAIKMLSGRFLKMSEK